MFVFVRLSQKRSRATFASGVEGAEEIDDEPRLKPTDRVSLLVGVDRDDQKKRGSMDMVCTRLRVSVNPPPFLCASYELRTKRSFGVVHVDL